MNRRMTSSPPGCADTTSFFIKHSAAVIAAATLFLVGCDSSSDPALSDQEQQLLERLQAPVITSVNALGSPAYPGSQLEITVQAYSPLDSDLSYDWSIPDSWLLLHEDESRIRLQAPYELAATAPVVITVSDDNSSRSASLDIATKGPAIEQFSIKASPDAAKVEQIDFSVTAYNRDGGRMDFEYRLGGFAIGGGSSEWQWVATPAHTPGFYDANITVSDLNGLNSQASSTVWRSGLSNWTSEGADLQNTHRNSPSATGPLAPPENSWQFGTGTVRYTTPVVGPDGMIYVIVDNDSGYKIAAIDPSALPANRLAWTYDSLTLSGTDYDLERVSNMVVDDNNDLYVATCLSNDDCYLIRLNTQAGPTENRLRSGRLIEGIQTSQPLRLSIDQDRVAYLSNGRYVRAFSNSATNMNPLMWEVELANPARGHALGIGNTLFTIEGFGPRPRRLNAINTRSDSVTSPFLWRENLVHATASTDFYKDLVTGEDGTLYTLSSGYLSAIDVYTDPHAPKSLWTYPDPENTISLDFEFSTGQASIHNNHLYVIRNEFGQPNQGQLVAFDLSQSQPEPQILWESGEDFQSARAFAIAANSTLYLVARKGSDASILALNIDPDFEGERLLWESDGHAIGGTVEPRIVIANDALAISSGLGFLLLTP